jgi:hypothetical protein
MESTFAVLELEVVEIERRGKPGCGSSSTHPRCTCPVAVAPKEEEVK